MRIGINLGDIIVEPDGDIYGDGANVAARLEQVADALVEFASRARFMRRSGIRLRPSFEDRGEQQVKNIARPVRVYAFWHRPALHEVKRASRCDCRTSRPLRSCRSRT